ncbi:MAG: sulfite exporter TauE/SafE family protein [candidate division Zixibacteria bacterium]|nr:sulfite exporter TauE/SafE family protein [candidate division Zixibacteria bacterium]
MQFPGMEGFLQIDWSVALQVVTLGFIGGVLSGFIGSGGAFFMTPGMMNLGVPGVIAVGTNIAHKFGKAIMGSRKHGEMGHVDKKLGLFQLITAVVGIRLAVLVNEKLFSLGGDSKDAAGSAAGDLYISVVFVVVLLFVSIFILRDSLMESASRGGPSRRLAEAFSRLRIPPMITFPVADVRLSFWMVSLVGLITGYLAGTIGVGGFVGVPAMIYIFGVPTAVAAGTELYLAIFMGAFGAINYAWDGFVDIRLLLLLYLGSLLGIYIGAYGTRVVREKVIRLVTGVIIMLCVVSRAINIPVYLSDLSFMSLTEGTVSNLGLASKLLLYASGVSGVVVILGAVARAWLKRRRALEILRRIQS